MKKAMLLAAAAVVILLGAFVTYSYFSPDIRIAIGKPVDPNTENYVQQTQIAFSTKLGLPMPKWTRNRIREFSKANEEVVLDLQRNYSAPIRVKACVEVSNGQTIVSYVGTATNASGETEKINKQLVFDFVLTKKIV